MKNGIEKERYQKYNYAVEAGLKPGSQYDAGTSVES